MTLSNYDPEMTMRAARAQYFDVNKFGPVGGYDDAWVDFKLGPIPFPFPNTAARLRAVKVHDLHHILTGYDTNFLGECEIGAWEIGAGCKDFIAAWVLNLMAMGAVMLAPKKVFRAFVRGRNSRSLYGENLEALLELTVKEARSSMSVPDVELNATVGDWVRFTAACGAGGCLGLVFLAVCTPLAPLGFVVMHLKRARENEGVINANP